MAAAIAVALAVSEIALRITQPGTFYVWPPGLTETFFPDPAALPGISGPSHFTINAQGMRADAPNGRPPDILTVGGSTTECLFLDDTEAWPRVLQDTMSTAARPIAVANVGKSGHRTRQHILQVDRLLPQNPNVHTVVLLAGLNDLQRALQGELVRREPIGPQDYPRAFMVFPSYAAIPDEAPFYEKARLYSLVARPPRVEVPKAALVQDVNGRFYGTFRQRRRLAPRPPSLPDLTAPLDQYRDDLRAVADAANRHGAKLILMTQPAIWRPDLPPELEALTWFGWSPTNAYYSTAQLAEALGRYNGVLLDVCRERGLDCFDLASQLPKDTTVFYDDCHFNEHGARRVAELLAEFLRSRLPLAP